MNIIDCEQGSDAWKQARAGKVTASCVADVMAKGKSGEAATRKNYKAKLVCERLTGVPCERGFKSIAMQDGNDLEKFARTEYELRTGFSVEQVGMVLHPTIENFSASPDGLIGEDGVLEIKCGFPATHLGWFQAGRVPAEYAKQMLGEMACCERQWVDFVSYCPEMPEHLQLFIVRFMRDETRIAEMEIEVVKFNSEVDAVLIALEKL